jgi:hypothetical protein
VATAHPDPQQAAGFYTELFGWAAEDLTPSGSSDGYFLCRLRGSDVAAIGSHLGSEVPDDAPPSWNTDFWVGDAEAAAAKAADLGGSVIAPPFDTPVGKTAVLADPQGAAFSVSKVGP